MTWQITQFIIWGQVTRTNPYVGCAMILFAPSLPLHPNGSCWINIVMLESFRSCRTGPPTHSGLRHKPQSTANLNYHLRSPGFCPVAPSDTIHSPWPCSSSKASPPSPSSAAQPGMTGRSDICLVSLSSWSDILPKRLRWNRLAPVGRSKAPLSHSVAVMEAWHFDRIDQWHASKQKRIKMHCDIWQVSKGMKGRNGGEERWRRRQKMRGKEVGVGGDACCLFLFKERNVKAVDRLRLTLNGGKTKAEGMEG